MDTYPRIRVPRAHPSTRTATDVHAPRCWLAPSRSSFSARQQPPPLSAHRCCASSARRRRRLSCVPKASQSRSSAQRDPSYFANAADGREGRGRKHLVHKFTPALRAAGCGRQDPEHRARSWLRRHGQGGPGGALRRAQSNLVGSARRVHAVLIRAAGARIP